MGGGKGMPGPMDFGQARSQLVCLVFLFLTCLLFDINLFFQAKSLDVQAVYHHDAGQ